MKRVAVVGSNGQDGRILCESLRKKGDAVLGLARDHITASEPFHARTVDLNDGRQVGDLIQSWRPDFVYYLAAFNHSSQDRTTLTPAELLGRNHAIHVGGLVHFLEAIRRHLPSSRLFYAASSLVFGHPAQEMQSEQSPFNPTCAYGITKAAGVHCCRLYRETYGVFASCGILFNHESPLRKPQFVSQKIIQGALAIQRGEMHQLVLGDLEARIDWGAAEDYVDAMQRILAHDVPDDFIVATGETHRVKEFVEIVFATLGLAWKAHVASDPTLLARSRAVIAGDATKLRTLTGWRPQHSFAEMVGHLLQVQRHES